MPLLCSNDRRFGRALVLALLLAFSLPATGKIEVEVEGLEGAEKKNVEQRLSIRAAAKDQHLDQGAVEALHALAQREIEGALQPFGYYEPTVRGTLTGAAPAWKATYTIAAGPPTLLDQVDFAVRGEAAADPELQAILDELPLAHGDRLLHLRYEEAKAKIGRVAYRRGFLDARFTRAELRVRLADRRADALVTLESGPRYEFGEVTIDQAGLDPGLVARYVHITPGTPFDPQQLLDARFALTDLDYFQTVEAEPQRERLQGRRLPVLIRTTPRLKYHYEAGIGYGTDTGARLLGATEFRRLNARGHKLALDLRLSELKNAAGAEYRIPAGRRAGESLSLHAAAADERLEDGRSAKWSLGTSLARSPGQWRRRYYLEFQHEESELGGVTQTSDLLIPGVSMSRTSIDDPIHARRGWTAFVDGHFANRVLLANTDFVQLRTQLRGVLPLGENGRLLGRYEYGASFVDEFSELPASQRFFAGGDQSVRGYRYQSLGPKDPQGRVIGGKFLTAFSVEAEYFPWEQWGGAVFHDAGGADDDPSPTLAHGVGVGARYRAPIGFLQLDLAHPLSGDASGVRLHLGVRVGL